MSATEGIVAAVGDQQYIIPIVGIRESLRPDRADCFTVEKKSKMIWLRGELMPLIRLGGLFGIRPDCADI